jgi:cell division protein FtsB
MKLSYPAVALIAVLAACNPASAQSTTDILQRLEALEKSNADLKKENAALRDRVLHGEMCNSTSSLVS